nr:hypothetical protein [Tanacetum cinerariifolium]
MFLGPPKACHVRLAFFGPCQHGIGLSSSPLYFSCLVGHGAHCDNTVQAQKSGTARLGFCYLSVLPSSFAVARAFATFPCIGSKSVSRDAVPKSSEFNVEHYATLVRIGERQRGKDEPKLLETTVGRVVPLLPVAPARSSGELEASVDKLFDEGGTQAEQGDSVGDRGGQECGSQGDPIPTFPFVTSSVSGTLEREGKGHTDSVTGLNLRTISAPQRPFVPVITAATTVTPTAGSAMVVKEKIVKPFLFSANSASARIYSAMGSFADLSGKDFLVGGIRTVISPDTDLQKVYVPQWSVTNGSRLDDGRVFREMVDGFAPPKFFASIRGMEHDQLFTDFNESEAAKAIRLRVEASQFKVMEKSLRDEVNSLNGRNIILNALDVKVTDLKATVASQERKLTDSNAQLTRIKYHNDDLANQVHELQDAQLKSWDNRYQGYRERYARWVSSRDYPTVFVRFDRRKPRLTLYLHGREGRVLTDVAFHNPSAEADYIFALQQLQSVNFPLLAELKANKAASIEAFMNILRLEEHLAKILGLNELQPHADQLMVPIHHSPDNIVVGASAVSFALDVSDARVRRIRENIMSHMCLFQDVFVPLVEPLSAAALTGMEGTFNVVPASADITTTLFVTLASTGTVTRLCVDDYGVMGTDDQSAVNENEDANPFPNVDDAELNIPQ